MSRIDVKFVVFTTVSADVTGTDLLPAMRSVEVTSSLLHPRPASCEGEIARRELLCVSTARVEHQILYSRACEGRHRVARAPSEARAAYATPPDIEQRAARTAPVGARIPSADRYAFSSAPSGTIPWLT